MSFVDRINRRIIDNVKRRKPQYAVGDKVLNIITSDRGGRNVSFSDLSRATLISRDIYVGVDVALSLTFVDGTRAEFYMDDPQWHVLTKALDESGRIPSPSRLWQLQMLITDATPRELIPPRA